VFPVHDLAERLAGRTARAADPAPGGFPGLGDRIGDAGLLALAARHPDEVADLVGPEPDGRAELLERVRCRFGVDHHEVGRYLARLWGLPGPIGDAGRGRTPDRRAAHPGTAPTPGDRQIRIGHLRPDPPTAGRPVIRVGPTRSAIDIPRGGT
jgi:hypothetical protein